MLIKTLENTIDISDDEIKNIKLLSTHSDGPWIDSKDAFKLNFSTSIVLKLFENLSNLSNLDISMFSKYEYTMLKKLSNYLLLDIVPNMINERILEIYYPTIERITTNNSYCNEFIKRLNNKKINATTELVNNVYNSQCGWGVRFENISVAFYGDHILTIKKTLSNHITNNKFMFINTSSCDITVTTKIMDLNIHLFCEQLNNKKFKAVIISHYIDTLMK